MSRRRRSEPSVVPLYQGCKTKYRISTVLPSLGPCNVDSRYIHYILTSVPFIEHLTAGSTEFIVLRPLPPLSRIFLYCLAQSGAFCSHAIQSMRGTSGRRGCRMSSWDAINHSYPQLHYFNSLMQLQCRCSNR